MPNGLFKRRTRKNGMQQFYRYQSSDSKTFVIKQEFVLKN